MMQYMLKLSYIPYLYLPQTAAIINSNNGNNRDENSICTIMVQWKLIRVSFCVHTEIGQFTVAVSRLGIASGKEDQF